MNARFNPRERDEKFSHFHSPIGAKFSDLSGTNTDMRILSDTAVNSMVAFVGPSPRSLSVEKLVSPLKKGPQHHSAWVEELSPRIEHLTQLEEGWDGPGSVPVPLACGMFALNMLESLYQEGVEAPDAIPGADGSLQIAWQCGGFEIDIDIDAPNKATAYRLDLRDYKDEVEDEETIEIEDNFSKLAEWVREMRQRVLQEQENGGDNFVKRATR